MARSAESSVGVRSLKTRSRHCVTLADAKQGQYTQQPVSKQIDVARSLSVRSPDPAMQAISPFLDEAESAFYRRNDLVHSSFPAQADGRLWGHRPTRDKSVVDGTADTVETSIGQLRAFIVELAELVKRFNQLQAIASTSRVQSSADPQT